MDKQVRQVLERVAEGVWCQHDGGFYAYHQCAFCCCSSQSEHDDDCEVTLARRALNEM